MTQKHPQLVAFTAAVCAVVLGLGVSYYGWLPLGLLGAAVLCWVSIRYPGKMVLLLLLWLPVEGWILKFIPGSSVLLAAPDAIAAAMAVGVLMRLGTRRAQKHGAHISLGYLAPFILLFVVAVLAWIVGTASMIDALYWFRVHFRFVPLALVLVEDETRHCVLEGLGRIGSIVVLSQAAIGLAEYVGGTPVASFFWPGQFSLGAVSTAADTLSTVGSRVVAGTLGHYNQYGLVLVIWVAILLGHALDRHKKESLRAPVWLSLAIASGSVAVLLSQSRQAAALLIVVYFFWMQVQDGIAKKLKRLGMVLATIIVVMATPLGDGLFALIGRFDLLADVWYWSVDVAKNRGYVLVTVSLATLGSAPILGLGPGSFGSSFAGAAGPTGVLALGLDPLASNFIGDVGWVSVLGQVGLLGVGCLLWVLAILIRSALSTGCPMMARLGGVGVAAVLGVGMFASMPITYKSTSSLMWIVYGLVALCAAADLTSGKGHRPLGSPDEPLMNARVGDLQGEWAEADSGERSA